MKKIGLIAVTLIMSITAFSQGKYGKTPQDSIECLKALAIVGDNVKSDPKIALGYWRKAYKICPASSKNIYIHGEQLFEYMIKNSKSEEARKAYADTLMKIYDDRIKYFGQEGYVLGKKGSDMLKYQPEKLEEAFEILNKSIDLEGNNSNAGALVSAMLVAAKLQRDNKITEDDVLSTFEKTMDIVDYNLANNPKKQKYYLQAQENIEKIAEPYLTCEKLVPLAEKNYEAKKDDLEWLKKTIKLLKAKKCVEAPIFATIAENIFEKEPNAEAAENLAKLFLYKKDYNKAIEYYKKAIENAKEGDDIAEYHLGLAKAYRATGNFSAARSSALSAANAKSGFGEPYILIGDLYAESSKTCNEAEPDKWACFWAAVDMYQKAKAVDSSVADEANKKIAIYKQYFPSKNDAFFHNLKDGDNYHLGCWINTDTTVRTN
jgi:tetratricopeptide (TPR) repeat protein